MSDEIKRDFISFLPSELVSQIFDLAYKDKKPPLIPISRAFLPFQRISLFRHVKVSSPPQFQLLIEAYESNSELGRMVETMEIEHAENEERKSRNDRQLKTFFSSLIHLEQLKLGQGTTSLIDLVLSLRIARSDLPQLHTLDFEIPSNWKKPFDSKNYRYLNSYPSLRILRLTTDDSHMFKCNSRGGEKIENVKGLSLAGINVDNSSTLSFIQNFPSLGSLSLDTLTSHHAEYSSLTASLPTSLTSLSLRNKAFFDEYSKPCDQHFPRLVNLEYLYLGEGTFSQNVINSLTQLPNLKILGFGRGAILGCSRLEELIVGPHHLSSVEKVILDQVEGKAGWKIEVDSDGSTLHPDHDRSPFHLGPGWKLPAFDGYPHAAFEEADVRSLVKKIKDAGIVIEGKIVDAFGIVEDWSYEMYLCMMAHAMETGEYDEMRKMFGDECVDSLFEAGIFDYGYGDYGCECGECY